MKEKTLILIVDDKEISRETLAGMLSNMDYELDFACNGLEALKKAGEILPDLILLDVVMPEMDGFEVCRKIRSDQALSETPVIMVTGLNDRQSRLQGIEAGADDFISKPVDIHELRARVKTITKLNNQRRMLIETVKKQNEELRELNIRLKQFVEEQASDVTNLLLTERDTFKWILEHSEEGYIIIDDEAKILYGNKQAKEYLSAEDEIINRPFVEYIKNIYSPETDQSWEKLIKEKTEDMSIQLIKKVDTDKILTLRLDFMDISSEWNRRYLITLKEIIDRPNGKKNGLLN